MGKRKLIRHGTTKGFSKHRRVRSGNWPMPPGEECGCAEAQREWRRERDRKPLPVEQRRQRDRARQRALLELRRMYPQDYAKLYAEELSSIKDGGQVELSSVQSQLRLLTQGVNERELRKYAGDGSATVRERELLERLATLRKRAAELEEMVAAWRQRAHEDP